MRICLSPDSVECLPSCIDSHINILLRGCDSLSDDIFCGWVDNVKRFATVGSYQLSINV
jgi:hypothetical protein